MLDKETWFIFTSESNDAGEPLFYTLKYVCKRNEEQAALDKAENMAAELYNRNVHVFKGTLIAEAIGGEPFGPTKLTEED